MPENMGMRIVFNGQQVESLKPKIAKRIDFGAERPLVEGVILSTDEVVDAAARRYRITLGWVGGIGAAILIAAAVIALDYEPADMIVVGPLYLAIAAAFGLGLPPLYRRRMSRMRDDISKRLARMAPPGTAIRLDTEALTIGGRATPWSAIAIEAVEIVTVPVPEGEDDYRIEAVVLDTRDGTVVLDQAVISNGAQIVNKALRTMCVDFLIEKQMKNPATRNKETGSQDQRSPIARYESRSSLLRPPLR
jgi:hypothetical protein